MNHNKLRSLWLALWILLAAWFAGCQTTSLSSENPNEEVAPATAENEEATSGEFRSMAPDRVDVRGFINRKVYHEGQLTIFVEGTRGQGALYDRAWVLVTPITQIMGKNGKRISLSELSEGQRVAVTLRGRGQQLGTFAGRGIANRLWVE